MGAHPIMGNGNGRLQSTICRLGSTVFFNSTVERLATDFATLNITFVPCVQWEACDGHTIILAICGDPNTGKLLLTCDAIHYRK